MPIYDYICSACGHLTEVIHGIDDHGPRFCPECGADGTMTKAVTAPTVHFKGSGWAKKDRTTSTRKAATASDEAAPATADSKPGKDSGNDGDAGSASKEEPGTAPADKPSGGGSAESSGTPD